MLEEGQKGLGLWAGGAPKLRASDAAGNKKVQGYLARATPKQQARTPWRVFNCSWTNEGKGSTTRSGNKSTNSSAKSNSSSSTL